LRAKPAILHQFLDILRHRLRGNIQLFGNVLLLDIWLICRYLEQYLKLCGQILASQYFRHARNIIAFVGQSYIGSSLKRAFGGRNNGLTETGIATPSARIDNTACTFLALRQSRSILCEFEISDLDKGLWDALTGKGTGAHTLQYAFIAARPPGMTYSPAVPY